MASQRVYVLTVGSQLWEVASALQNGQAVLPVPLLPRPSRMGVRSGRLRQRLRRKQEVREVANRILGTLNATYSGSVNRQTALMQQKFCNELMEDSAVGQ
eukprot:1646734-Pyramimonas_sp.AAC.2